MISYMDNPYEILGLAQDADESQIRGAYRQLVRDLHPDIHPESHVRVENEERLKKVNIAYQQLKKSFARGSGSSQKAARAKGHEPVSTGFVTQNKDDTRNVEEEAKRYWAAYHKAKRGLK